LVSYILKNNVKYFSASSPKRLEEYIRKRRQEIEEKEDALRKILPDLEALEKFKEEEYSVEIYMGVKGFKSAMFTAVEKLKPGTEFVAIGVSGARKTAIATVFHQLSSLTKEKKIKTRLIVTDASESSKKAMQEFQKEFFHLEYRFLPGFSLAPIDVFGDITILLNFERLSAIVIRSPTIAGQFKSTFESLWNISKR
jgi:hypothetical protein